jgi:flagellar basal-body rod protein FlgF
MIRGLYTSGYGMMTLNRKMDVISNNLANVDTNGFKKDAVIFEEFSDVLAKRLFDYQNIPRGSASDIGNMALFNDIAMVHTDFTEGSLENTNLKTDLAINGDGAAFFAVAVRGSDGNYREYYTRDGSFKLDSQGRLVTKDGFTVMGLNGAIVLDGSDFTVNTRGEIFQDNVYVDTLKIRKIDNPESLRKFGMNLLTATAETRDGAFEGEVLQGFVERSNIDSVKEMVDMITVLRSYEANQKMIQYQDATLDKAVNEIGRV